MYANFNLWLATFFIYFIDNMPTVSRNIKPSSKLKKMVGVTHHMSKLACITYISKPEDIIEDYIYKVYIDGPCELLVR